MKLLQVGKLILEKNIELEAPKHIFLSSEPFPFSEKHIEDIQLAVPNALIHLVDGEWFSWYGVRMLEAASHLRGFCKSISNGTN